MTTQSQLRPEPSLNFICDGDDGQVYRVEAYRKFNTHIVDGKPLEVQGDNVFCVNGRQIMRVEGDTFRFANSTAPLLTKR